MKKVKTIAQRMLAVAIATALGTIGGGAVLGLDTAKTAALAAIMAIAVVSEDLARAFIADGSLSEAEINAAFSKAAEAEVPTPAVAPAAPAPVAEAAAPVAEAAVDPQTPVELNVTL